MPSKMAIIDFNKCNPEECDEAGICKASLACERKLLTQETPYEIPMTNPFLCRGCSDCIRTCPEGAIFLSKV